RMAFPLPDKPSVAVLPFDNMTGDPKQDYFVDGITGGIITMLAKVPQLFVSARTSTSSYKGKPVPVSQVAEELGVRYVLEGSVQRSKDRIRLNAQLIDALTGHHVWAERYDRELSDILVVQDQIAEEVVAALEVVLTEGEQRRVRRAETSNPEAYDYYVRARQTYLNFTEADILQARKLWLKAFELDPQYAGALASVGYSHAMAVLSGWSDDPAQDLKQARAYAEQSLAIDDTNPDAYALMGRLALFDRLLMLAVEYAQRAVELSPSHADNTALLGLFLSYAGRHAEALQAMNRAMRLAPHYPNWYSGIVGAAKRFQGNLDEAINAFEQERDRTPNSPRPYIWLASTYAEAGREEAARTAAEELLARNPNFSIKQFAKFQAWKNPEDLERLVDGLRKAGLPE
ncbi:MAG: tetratricopeptide repeat protein, partial [Acidiferrobacterales bacterium]|nr:tetratricopeptide repeat protein [Acidiferrobacterales bacterium]